MSLTIARTRTPGLHGLSARAIRAVAVAVLAVGLQVPATVAAGSPDGSILHTVRAPIAAIAVASAGSAGVPLNDDGEDHFDEGDDGYNCDNVNEGEDPCQDNPPDRVDAGDDEFDAGDEAGCDNYDDGEDRCLDNGEGRLDAPLPSRATLDTELTAASPAAAASPDPTPGLAALAAVIALGAGGLWLLRRAQR